VLRQQINAVNTITQALVMQFYRCGSLARAFSEQWYQALTEVERLRYGLQVSEVAALPWFRERVRYRERFTTYSGP
jgi:hypothetical protein